MSELENIRTRFFGPTERYSSFQRLDDIRELLTLIEKIQGAIQWELNLYIPGSHQSADLQALMLEVNSILNV